MKLAKWGNSLAVRVPANMVQEENLQEGDDLDLRFIADRVLEISRNNARLEALEVIRKLRRPLPAGYKFNRDEIYERRGSDDEEKAQ